MQTLKFKQQACKTSVTKDICKCTHCTTGVQCTGTTCKCNACAYNYNIHCEAHTAFTNNTHMLATDDTCIYSIAANDTQHTIAYFTVNKLKLITGVCIETTNKQHIANIKYNLQHLFA